MVIQRATLKRKILYKVSERVRKLFLGDRAGDEGGT